MWKVLWIKVRQYKGYKKGQERGKREGTTTSYSVVNKDLSKDQGNELFGVWGKGFPTKGNGSAKAARQVPSWCVSGEARKPVWLQQNDSESRRKGSILWKVLVFKQAENRSKMICLTLWHDNSGCVGERGLLWRSTRRSKQEMMNQGLDQEEAGRNGSSLYFFQ